MRHRLFNESCTMSCQEIEELRRLLRRNRWSKTSCIKRNPSTASPFSTQDLQNEANPLSDARDRHDLEHSAQLWSVPRFNPWPFPSPRGMPCRDSGLLHKNKGYWRYFGKRFWKPTYSTKTNPSTLLKKPGSRHHLLVECDRTPQEILWDRKENWDESRRIRWYLPCFPSGGGILNHAGGTLFSLWYDWLHEVSDLEGASQEIPDSMEFHCWKVNIKTEVCSKSADPHITMQWVQEVEIAKSVDELVTSWWMIRTDFSDFDVLDAMIASALKKHLDKHVHFRKKSECRRAACSKTRPFLAREANCIHDLWALSSHQSSQVVHCFEHSLAHTQPTQSEPEQNPAMFTWKKLPEQFPLEFHLRLTELGPTLYRNLERHHLVSVGWMDLKDLAQLHELRGW